MPIKILSRISLIFFLYIIISYFYIGLFKVPSEGDSLNYHVPLAKAYLDGKIFDPRLIDAERFLKYSPGASQGILSVFYLFHVPPGLFNVLGVFMFFLSLFYLGRKLGFENNYSVIFASCVATINGIVRWMDTQLIDIYLVSFFSLALALLQKPEKKNSYFLKLGIVMGMLIGSKYSGLLFGIVLGIVYGIKLVKYLNVKRAIIIATPIFVLGFSWYVRNYLVTGNPMYPQGFLFFKDHGFRILNHQVWSVAMSSSYGFFGTINALISEYMIWVLAIPIVSFYFVKRIIKYKKLDFYLIPIFIVGALNYIIYLYLPSDNSDNIMVSVVRYSYCAFVPFALLLFDLAKRNGWSEKISIVGISNALFIGFPIVYNPKLVFIFIPIALFIFSGFFHERYSAFRS